MVNVKTYNRGKLWRLCQDGRLQLTGSYKFDDQYGAERTQGEDGMPVLPAPKSVHDRRQGICYLRADEFRSGSGTAWENPDGTVTLHVHSNSNYTFRIMEELK